MKKSAFYLICVIYLTIPQSTRAQQMTVSLPNLTGVSPGTILDIPVWGNYWGNVGATCITIEYDTTALNYINYQNINPIFSSGFPLFNEFQGQIQFGWFGLTAISFVSDTLFYLRFQYINGCAEINFNVDTVAPSQGCYFPVANNGSINCPAGIKESFTDEIDFQIYPNPGRENLTISYCHNLSPMDGTLKIFDKTGSLLYCEKVESSSCQIKLEHLNLSPGEYFVCLSTVGGREACKPYLVY